MNSSSLSGLRVLITRPEPQHSAISSAIQDNGGIAIHFPLLKIERVENGDSVHVIKSKIENLDNYHILIFISSNAAQLGATWINNYWPQFPIDVQVIAVGPSTARMVSAELDCKVIHSESGASSEDVLSLDELKAVKDKKVAIFRGEGGRELLAETLSARGAAVEYIEVYTRADADNTSQQLASIIKDDQINALSVSSGESLNRLNKLLEETNVTLSGSKEVPIIVPSVRVAALAEQLGFSTVKIANGADVEATINALQELAN
ncbi:MAG: hypothetical protein GKR91_15515 [Pseudomonadales bacterium]|nr:hypothetical protein [Pseudomonadales bacterium]